MLVRKAFVVRPQPYEHSDMLSPPRESSRQTVVACPPHTEFEWLGLSAAMMACAEGTVPQRVGHAAGADQ